MRKHPALPSGNSSSKFWEHSFFQKKMWLPIVFAAVAAVLMPLAPFFSFQIEKNQVWHNNTLVAPFDFEVLRPTAELPEKLAAIEAEHGAYFWVNVEVAKYQKKRFANLVQRQSEISQHDEQFVDLTQNTSKYQIFGQQLLENVYQKGICETSTITTNTEFAYLIFPNSEKKVLANELLTLKTAQLLVIDSLPYLPLRQPELILPLLEKCLAPNLFYSDSLSQIIKKKKIAAARSTGFSYNKGQKIVEKGQKVSEEQWLALQTLTELTAPKNKWKVLGGHGLIALLCFGALFFYFDKMVAPPADEKMKISMFGSIVITLLFVRVLSVFGMAIPLLLPVFILPHYLGKYFGGKNTLATWFAILIIVSFSMSWGAVWLPIQLAGWLVLMFGSSQMASLEKRLILALLTGAAMNLVWLAALLSEKLPTSLTAAEVPILVFVSAILGTLIVPTGWFFYHKLNETIMPSEENAS